MSRRFSTWAIVVIALAVIAAGLSYLLSGSTADQQLRDASMETVQARGMSRSDSTLGATPSPSGLDAQPYAAPTAHPAHEPPNPASLLQPRQTSSGTPGGNEQTSVSASPDDSAPDSVVGRPFGVSASVEAECKHHGEDAICAGFHRTLKRFTEERRDPAWANRIEVALREHVNLSEPGKFTIRNVECRTTICAIELQSVGPYSGYGGRNSSDFEHSQNIYLDQLTHGYEYTQARERVTITAVTYIRK